MKTRTRRRRSTRSADQDATVCPTASAMKPSASRLTAMIESRALPAGAIHMQLTKLNAATASPDQPVPPAQAEPSSNSARVEQPEHHDIAGRQRDQRRMPGRDRRRDADRIGHGMRGRAERKGRRRAGRPALFRKSRNSDAASTSSSATVAARNASSRAASGIKVRRCAAALGDHMRFNFVYWPSDHGGHPDIGGMAEQIGLAFDRGAEPPRHGLRRACSRDRCSG